MCCSSRSSSARPAWWSRRSCRAIPFCSPPARSPRSRSRPRRAPRNDRAQRASAGGSAHRGRRDRRCGELPHRPMDRDHATFTDRVRSSRARASGAHASILREAQREGDHPRAGPSCRSCEPSARSSQESDR